VDITIQLWDYDGFLNGNDDPLDIEPDPSASYALLRVDPITGTWTGSVTSPNNVLEGDGAGGFYRSHLEFTISTPFTNISGPDSDGDGLLDSWETNGIDLNGDGIPEVDLPAMGARPDHKDIFLELDWMDGAAPRRDDILALKAAFAAAPIDAGTQASALPGGINSVPNPDGKPGINVHVDTGDLRDAFGRLVGDDFHGLGRGNRLDTANVSNLNSRFYDIKSANFDAVRRLAFHYAVNATGPGNLTGTSTGGNSATTLEDTHQDWVPGEWGPGWNSGITLNLKITGGKG